MPTSEFANWCKLILVFLLWQRTHSSGVLHGNSKATCFWNARGCHVQYDIASLLNFRGGGVNDTRSGRSNKVCIGIDLGTTYRYYSRNIQPLSIFLNDILSFFCVWHCEAVWLYGKTAEYKFVLMNRGTESHRLMLHGLPMARG